MAKKHIVDSDLIFHFLNVGFGDTTIIEFPKNNGQRQHALVDCRLAGKTKKYLQALREIRPAQPRLAFACATHPHYDHISGMGTILKDNPLRPHEFFDSGFRHNSITYWKILRLLQEKKIPLERVTSGMERYFGRVRMTALAPSISLRNRYATYGVDVNNASVVLRFEHHQSDVLFDESERYQGDRDPVLERQAGKSVTILGGDAEFDSWAKIAEEFPKLESTDEHQPLVKKMINMLSCSVIKVSHHGSMHSIPLDVYERMSPHLAVISTRQKISSIQAGGRHLKRGLFPHRTASLALAEVGACVVTTDGSNEGHESSLSHPGSHAGQGSVVVVVPKNGRPRFTKLDDTTKQIPNMVDKV
jgi:beta-lactamase superfamily II metal-dependent hydrolase